MIEGKDLEVYQTLVAVVRSLVDRPDDVEVTAVASEASTTFKVTVHSGDLGKVIGIHGRTARALRTILSANAARLKRSFSLDIGEKSPAAAKSPTSENVTV